MSNENKNRVVSRSHSCYCCGDDFLEEDMETTDYNWICKGCFHYSYMKEEDDYIE